MAKTLPEIFESFTSVMELLRNKEFQKLLVNYERAKKVFLVGYEVQDEVSSMVLFETNENHLLKPEDYLIAFSEFVKVKEVEIEAISILLNKPKDWNTKALNELKQKLKESKYDDASLQRAHRIVYHKDTVDIISMVKHAANATEPLLSPEERVDMAIRKVTEGKLLTPDQQKWMEYIKEHLKLNMTLDKEDFYEDPVLERKGGFKKFKEVFATDYDLIISEINKAIAA
jgi:type I restriction enzyme, R subunit